MDIRGKKRVLVVDGQGGGIGKSLIDAVKDKNLDVLLVAAGTNEFACSKMKKGGADIAVWGENAILEQAAIADVVCGPIGIIISGALMGEISSRIAQALAENEAVKVLVPLNKCNIFVAGIQEKNLTANIKCAAERIAELCCI